MAERCDACRLWRRLTEDSGECRALPPRPTAPCGLKISAVWPLTLAAEWCGGWRPYPVARVAGAGGAAPAGPGRRAEPVRTLLERQTAPTDPDAREARAFGLGCDARLAGVPLLACPYDPLWQRPLACAWRRGWSDVDRWWGADALWKFRDLPEVPRG